MKNVRTPKGIMQQSEQPSEFYKLKDNWYDFEGENQWNGMTPEEISLDNKEKMFLQNEKELEEIKDSFLEDIVLNDDKTSQKIKDHINNKKEK
ncbi:MAG: hypothetical protein U9P90_02265 [Patescibacteria group bacterium]|nr:hypothetical protein [Patescibacteria group bacterium]